MKGWCILISKTLHNAIDDQIQAELYSSYLYRQMMLWCAQRGYRGFAHWMFVQVFEEDFHAAKFYGYLLDNGGEVALQPIQAPPSDFASLIDVFEKTYSHEQVVTARIRNLYDIAVKEQDPKTQNLLTWYLDEQVEEEESALRVLDAIRKAAGPAEVESLDKKYAGRKPGSDVAEYLGGITGFAGVLTHSKPGFMT